MHDEAQAAGISLEAVLPLAWTAEPQASNATRDLRRHGNLALLRGLAVIESATGEREHDLPEGVQKSLEHLESKLDLALLLLAELIHSRTALPPECRVTLYSDRIEWDAGDMPAPAVGEAILVSVYPSLRLPQPLQLPAVVTGVVSGPGSTRVFARIEALDAELGEWLTRTIFRYHRRALQARRQP
jgi:hypothetical protein